MSSTINTSTMDEKNDDSNIDYGTSNNGTIISTSTDDYPMIISTTITTTTTTYVLVSTNGATTDAANTNNDNDVTSSNTTSSSKTIHNHKKLYLCLLGCEPNPPYGPNQHTAQMLLDILGCAIQKSSADMVDNTTTNNTNDNAKTDNTSSCIETILWDIIIDVYDVQKYQYPNDWSIYNGFIIPGSFSSAYDEDDWIIQLKYNIQTIIIPNQYKTLAICFGHQVIAQSFSPHGSVCRTPTGSRIGSQNIHLSSIGLSCYNTILLSSSNNNNNEVRNNNNQIQQQIQQQEEEKQDDDDDTLDNYCIKMLVTHSDMVQTLPSNAICLGGCENVPIQIAAYFKDVHNKQQFCNNNNNNNNTLLSKLVNTNTTTTNHNDNDSSISFELPFAVTFQSHPEYSLPLGYTKSYKNCIKAMYDKKLISKERYEQVIRQEEENEECCSIIQNNSIDSIYVACRLLQWF